MLVFLFHLVLTVDRYSEAELRPWVQFGQFGVDLFFVISGFVMAHSVRDLAGGRDAADFVTRRFWRIAPLLYALTIAHLLLSMLRGEGFGLARIINCITIIPVMKSPEVFQYALIPAWTLGFEFLFYFLVAGAVALRGSALWAAAPILMLTLVPEYGPFGSTLMIEFIYGLIAYYLWKRRHTLRPLWLLAAAALTLASPVSEARFIAWGLPAALIFMATLAWNPADGTIERGLKWLGQISYSLYLSHVVTFNAVAPIAGSLGTIVLGIVLAVMGILIAWIVYECIEAPLWRLRDAGRPKLAVQTNQGKPTRANGDI